MEKFDRLIQYTLRSGAGGAVIISTSTIQVEKALARMCLEPRCEFYGMAKNCPPNVSGPSGFKKRLEKFSFALFFKVDIPSEILFSSQRNEVFQLLHEIASGIEKMAVDSGYLDAKAYAGGSCKTIFCNDYAECAVLSGQGGCRNPQSARQSMSGFGINVSKLMEKAGWSDKKSGSDAGDKTEKMSHVCGLVLLA